MPKAMTKADWLARAEAYQEASEHFGLDWTDDPKEREQGDILASVFRREAQKCHNIARAA